VSGSGGAAYFSGSSALLTIYYEGEIYLIRKDIQEAVDLIKELVEIPSPSGNTKQVIQYADDFFTELGVETIKNRKGSLTAVIPGKQDDQERMLTAHVDTLGAMVKEVKPNGRLKIDLIGGFGFSSVEGEYCRIETSKGEIFHGTILMKQTSVHVYKDAKTAERNMDNMEIRIDEKVASAEEVKALGINTGDFVSFDPRVQQFENGYLKSRHLDDKASVGLLMRLVKEIVEENMELPYTTRFLISNNEEIGYGGNSGIPPETVEYVAVDMGAMGDGQETDEHTVSICAKDASGPYHAGLRKNLVRLAERENIGYKVDMYPYYGSDASAAIRAGHDIIHGLIGPGIDSSHAFERTHAESLEATYDLLKAYVTSPMIEVY
jgi:putative aminopeptidase FrvX